MKFSEAVKALEDGEKIRCVRWDKGQFWSIHIDSSDFIRTDSKYLSFYIMWPDVEYRIKRMMEEEWEIYQEPQKTYSFAEVVKGWRKGKKYLRKGWLVKTPLTLSVENMEKIVVFGEKPYEPRITMSDFEGTDWIEVFEPPIKITNQDDLSV